MERFADPNTNYFDKVNYASTATKTGITLYAMGKTSYNVGKGIYKVTHPTEMTMRNVTISNVNTNRLGQIGNNTSLNKVAPYSTPHITSVNISKLNSIGSKYTLTHGVPKSSSSVRNPWGRKGKPETKILNQQAADYIQNEYSIPRINGTDMPEEYIRSLNGSRKGGNYVDITFEMPNGKRVRVNTVDVNSKGLLTPRELRAMQSIMTKKPNDIFIAIPKNVNYADMVTIIDNALK